MYCILVTGIPASGYHAITVTLTGDYHREVKEEDYTALTYEQYEKAVKDRGMDTFTVDGERLIVDTIDLQAVNKEEVLQQIRAMIARCSCR